MEEAESDKNGINRGAAWLIVHLPVDLNSHPTKKEKPFHQERIYSTGMSAMLGTRKFHF